MTEPERSVDSAPRVGGVVVVHGYNPSLAACLDALETQCDRVVVIDNLPDAETSAVIAGRGVVVHNNDRPLSFAENVNAGVGLLDTRYAAIVNPDAIADPGCISVLADFLDAEPHAAMAAPQLRWPDGSPQPTGRSFPSVGATLLRRTPLRRVWRPMDRQREHYRLDQLSAVEPWQADWLLGAFWLVRRKEFVDAGGLDVGYRMYVEDMDFCARMAAEARGRWVVPEATGMHEYQAVIDRRFLSQRNLWHIRGMARFARRHRSTVFGSR